jgi:hexosaminidase
VKELPTLAKRGTNFRIGQPGIIAQDGKLLANKQYPGVVIRYTFDGSEPTEKSADGKRLLNQLQKQSNYDIILM